jgi:hypothetical protein
VDNSCSFGDLNLPTNVATLPRSQNLKPTSRLGPIASIKLLGQESEFHLAGVHFVELHW